MNSKILSLNTDVLRSCDRPSSLPILHGQRGSSLLVVIIVIAILSMGMGTYMNSLTNYRRVQELRILDDKAMMAAEAGLATAITALQNMAAPPASDLTQTITLPSAQFFPFQTVTSTVHPQTSGTQQYYTVVATVAANNAATKNTSVGRRVQATLSQRNFAKYEQFINDWGGVWSPGYVSFLGLGTVFMGPVNINSGCAFFPNFWSLDEVTTAATGGVNVYANWGSYLGGVYGNASAHSAVSILNYFSSTYANAPQFYGGLRTLPTPVSLPTDMNTDVRAAELRTRAGLTLPDNYSGYVAAAGPNFVVDLSNSGSPGDGRITIRQYLGNASGSPSYGPPLVKSISAVNGAMIVKGNIVSLKGVLNGKLTIGAFASTANPTGGNINITGSLEYDSRKKQSGFKYTDAPGLFTADGSGINSTYVDTLQNQLSTLTDMLGIVSEGNVLIKQNDLDGNPIANNMAVPLYIDAVVMSTGASQSTPGSGGFGVENDLTRPPGQAYFLGGMIQNKQLNWSLYNGSGITNGIALTNLWDKRASQPGSAPPFFPTTGTFELVPNTWTSSYLESTSAPITYLSLP